MKNDSNKTCGPATVSERIQNEKEKASRKSRCKCECDGQPIKLKLRRVAMHTKSSETPCSHITCASHRLFDSLATSHPAVTGKSSTPKGIGVLLSRLLSCSAAKMRKSALIINDTAKKKRPSKVCGLPTYPPPLQNVAYVFREQIESNYARRKRNEHADRSLGIANDSMTHLQCKSFIDTE